MVAGGKTNMYIMTPVFGAGFIFKNSRAIIFLHARNNILVLEGLEFALKSKKLTVQ